MLGTFFPSARLPFACQLPAVCLLLAALMPAFTLE